MNLPGNSTAYCPMEERKIACTFTSSTAFTMAHAVKVLIKLNKVNNADTIIINPAQKLIS